MRFRILILFLLAVSLYCPAFAQDSSNNLSPKLAEKYLYQVDNKINKFDNQITSKTEKTLLKLVRWENKIQKTIAKVDPATEQKLFGQGKTTFSSLLAQYKNVNDNIGKQRALYSQYRDNVFTAANYISKFDSSKSKLTTVAEKVSANAQNLESKIAKQEAVAKLIKERKKELLAAATKVLGKNKNLAKINKEAYYYAETIANYKEIFSDSKKAEKVVITTLNRIPAFQKFTRENSMLASIFGRPSAAGSSAISLQGLQTRASVTALIQSRVGNSGPNVQQLITENMQQGQSQLLQLKEKLRSKLPTSKSGEMPDFKPNGQRSKTLLQRMEFGTNLQFRKGNANSRSQAEVALTAGYKLNDKSTIGVGLTYVAGYAFSPKMVVARDGVGFRSFLDWKLKKQIFVVGGYEVRRNYNLVSPSYFTDQRAYQTNTLLGLQKKLKLGGKYLKTSKVQALYDFNYDKRQATSPFIFRVGYDF